MLFLLPGGFFSTAFFAIRCEGSFAKLIGKCQVSDTGFAAILIMRDQLICDSSWPPVLRLKHIPAADGDGEFVFEKFLLDSGGDIADGLRSFLGIYPAGIAPAIEREAGIFPELKSGIAPETGLSTLCMGLYIIL